MTCAVTRQGRHVTITAPAVGTTIVLRHGFFDAPHGFMGGLRWNPELLLCCTPDVLRVLRRAVQRRERQFRALKVWAG